MTPTRTVWWLGYLSLIRAVLTLLTLARFLRAVLFLPLYFHNRKSRRETYGAWHWRVFHKDP